MGDVRTTAKKTFQHSVRSPSLIYDYEFWSNHFVGNYIHRNRITFTEIYRPDDFRFLPRDATQIAVLLPQAVCLSVRNVEVS